MTYFCNDADLLAWEPSVFVDEAFAHLARLSGVSAMLSETTLTVSGASLSDAGILPGMVAQLSNADASVTQLVEIAHVAGAAVMTVSALRGRASEPAVPPMLQGAVTVKVISFRRQIAGMSDSLLALVGVAIDADSGATSPVYADLIGFGPACVFGTLAALFRTLSEARHATSITFSKRGFYEGLAQASRLTLTATVDRDGDGVAETRVFSGMRELSRS